MNIFYAKTVLYAYTNVDAVAEQIDELVEKKALSSMRDFSPCEEQCEKIINLTYSKDVLFELKIFAEKALIAFNDEELKYLDYKYFKKMPKESFIGFDYTSRNYFRKQVRLAEKFAKRLEKFGADDQWFEKQCLKIDFLREMYKRVMESEIKNRKNTLAKRKFYVQEKVCIKKTA